MLVGTSQPLRNSAFNDAFQNTANVAGTGAAPEGIDQNLEWFEASYLRANQLVHLESPEEFARVLSISAPHQAEARSGINLG